MVLMQFMGLDAKWWAAGGVTAIAAVWWWRKNAATEAPVAEEDPYASDEGYGDGSAQGGTTPGLYGMYDPTTGTFIGSTGQPVQVITTNAQWAQQVLTSMTVTFADTYDPATIALAIAKYLSGKALSDVEYNIAETAIQLYGRPPTAVPDPHKVTPQPGQPGPVSGTVPSAPGGLKVDGAKPHYVRISWKAVTGATGYQWAVPSRGQYGPWQTGTAALVDMGGPKPGLKITLAVRARNSKGNGPWSSYVSYTLPKS